MKTRDGIRDCLLMQGVKITKRRAVTGICSASANNPLFRRWFGCGRRAKCLVEEHVTSLGLHSALANNLFAHRRFNTGNCVCQKGGVEQLSGCLRVEKRASETTWITEI